MATNTYVALNTITANGTTSTVTFNSIPQTYTDLVLVVSGGSVGGNGIKWRANGDTATSYGFQFLRGSTSSVAAARYNQTSGLIAWFATNVLGVTAIANFMNYSTNGVRKSVLCKGGYASSETSINVNTWTGTAPITSLEIFDESATNILSGTKFSLYGIKAEGNTTGTTRASGGTISKDSFGYVYHTFTSSGTFTPSANLTSAEALVVAGGGGAGGTWSGGGGAGGLRGLTGLTFANSTNYAVTVGAGGTGGGSNYAAGTNGVNSSIIGGAISQSSTGGGRGPATFDNTEYPGGSGGGGWGSYNGTSGTIADYGSAGNAGNYSPVEGYAGGYGVYDNSNRPAGGGGGAGGVGGNATAGGPGNGGIGSSAFSSWGQVTSTGQASNGLRYYAGGGGGGKQGGGSSGGLGGGGGHFTSGTANTGGGAGGGGDNIAGGNGGSGIVIIRYLGL
jgi:hypothetical protein